MVKGVPARKEEGKEDGREGGREGGRERKAIWREGRRKGGREGGSNQIRCQIPRRPNEYQTPRMPLSPSLPPFSPRPPSLPPTHSV